MFIFIAGATATGKSSLAVELGKRINAEIISCDSMQIYKNMNIGTAKITSSEMQGVPHHLLDFVEPKSPFSVAEYKNAAQSVAADIFSRGKLPVFVGGTGLYMNSLLFDYQFDGKKPIGLMKNPKIKQITVVLSSDREKLREKIDNRVDKMFEAGLLEEVKSLLQQGIEFSDQSMKGIGYKEFQGFFEEQLTVDQVSDLIKKNTKSYAKRQYTWFRSWNFAHWFDCENEREKCIDYILSQLDEETD